MRKLFMIAALLAAISSANAQNRQNTWYGKADLGGSWVADTDLKSLFGPVQGDTDVEFDPGVRFGLGAGYNLTDWFALEGEFGASWNEVDKLGSARQMEATLINMPLLVNAKLQLPNPTIVRPYVGAGVGGASSVMDIDHLRYGDIRISGSASDFVFAWQGFAGVQFELNENMSVGLEYHYVWTQAPEYEIDWGWAFSYTDYMELDDLQTHSVSVVFSYQF